MEDAKYTGKVSSTGVKQRGPSGAPIWSTPSVDVEARSRLLGHRPGNFAARDQHERRGARDRSRDRRVEVELPGAGARRVASRLPVRSVQVRAELPERRGQRAEGLRLRRRRRDRQASRRPRHPAGGPEVRRLVGPRSGRAGQSAVAADVRHGHAARRHSLGPRDRRRARVRAGQRSAPAGRRLRAAAGDARGRRSRPAKSCGASRCSRIARTDARSASRSAASAMDYRPRRSSSTSPSSPARSTAACTSTMPRAATSSGSTTRCATSRR